jgi:hypothetical protein
MKSKPILILVAITLGLFLLLVVSPFNAFACAEMTTENPDSDSCDDEGALPPYCSTGSCSLRILGSSIPIDFMYDNIPRFIYTLQNEDIYLGESLIGPAAGTTQNINKGFQSWGLPRVPTGIVSEYHCRNSLDSEDPFRFSHPESKFHLTDRGL